MGSIRAGITGTRNGGTPEQYGKLAEMFRRISISEFHHGDCKGVDATSARLVRALRPITKIISHPPINPTYRAFTTGDLVHEPKEYLARNLDIVNSIDLLLAVPETTETEKSGTWITVRYAREKGLPIIIIQTYGQVTRENQ